MRPVSKKVAVLCLAMLIYYVFATELAGMLKMKKDEEDDPAQKRRKVPDVSNPIISNQWSQLTATGSRCIRHLPL